MADVETKTTDSPDGRRIFLDGSVRDEVRVGQDVIGRGAYHPGWRSSEHVRPQTGVDSAAHTGYVISGRMAVRGADGTEAIVAPGGAFYAAPGDDAWVVGEETCVALDFLTKGDG